MFESLLKKALRAIEREFKPGELAYLALTQKVEHVFRDRLAYLLHKYCEAVDADYLVCREWLRADLAILKNGLPAMILEAKAGYSFDIFKEEGGYNFPVLIAKDLLKATALAMQRSKKSTPEIYALVIATHPKSKPDETKRDAVKYYKSVVRFSVPENNYDAIATIMRRRMNSFDLVDSHRVDGGAAFEVEVEVFVWLYRAKKMETKKK